MNPHDGLAADADPNAARTPNPGEGPCATGGQKPLVGIIGGMGPAATAHFSTLIAQRTEACRDADHVRTLVLNDGTIPDRSAFLCTGDGSESPERALVRAAQLLAATGCTLLAMPCNTAHAFASSIRAATDVPLLSMVAETAAVCARKGWRRVGILGTEGTRRAAVYGSALAQWEVEARYPGPGHQRQIDQLVYGSVKAGRIASPSQLQALLLAQIEQLRHSGCDGVVLGCTELSLIADFARSPMHPNPIRNLPVVDALTCLADRVILASGCHLRADAQNAEAFHQPSEHQARMPLRPDTQNAPASPPTRNTIASSSMGPGAHPAPAAPPTGNDPTDPTSRR